jgi:hypothetical protein
MIKLLHFKIVPVLVLIFSGINSFAQSLDANGDFISGKSVPNQIMAYTPCPSLTAIDSTYQPYNCDSLYPGWSVMTAMGGPNPFDYSWFKNIGYTPLALPAFSSNYSAMQGRGIWFTSPTNTVITGLRVPTDIGTANQFIYVVKWSTVPPTYPAQGSNYTVLGKFLNVPGTDTVKCGIPIYTGDIIGILGVRGSTTSPTANMSYAPGGFASSISGFPVTLYRFMSQTDITTNNLGLLCEGGSGSVGRVDVFFGSSLSLFNYSGPLTTGGNYVCFYADTNGCTSSSTITIIPGATITATSSFTNPTCSAGNNGSAMVIPSGGYMPYTYSWSPMGGASQVANGLPVGSYTCTISDSLGNCKEIVVTLGTCTGMNELNKVSGSGIYPNPSNGKFNIHSPAKSEFSVYNALGSKVYEGKLETGINTLDLTGQADGVYYLKIKDTGHFKIIKN